MDTDKIKSRKVKNMDEIALDKLNSIDTRLEVISATVSRLDKAITGNGQAGLLDRVNTIEGTMEDTRNNLDELKKSHAEVVKCLPPLVTTSKIAVWLAVAVGGSAITFGCSTTLLLINTIIK
jgi:hypothetical protein